MDAPLVLLLAVLSAAAAVAAAVWARWSLSAEAGLARSLFRMLFRRGGRSVGELSGVEIPTHPADLTGPHGPAYLTAMLGHGNHLPPGITVFAVADSGTTIRDGVKGDKALLEMQYADSSVDGATTATATARHGHGSDHDSVAHPNKRRAPGQHAPILITPQQQAALGLPGRVFVKFNLKKAGPMRLLVEASEVCRCEAVFYAKVAGVIADILPSPRCYFADWCATTGEFVLVSEVVPFGEGEVQPLKHRIRDANVLSELKLFVVAGATLNARLWDDDDSTPDGTAGGLSRLEFNALPRFEDTHRQLWIMAQLSARFGLENTARNTLGGKIVHPSWMTWSCPPGLRGRIPELISDMPAIMRTLCSDAALSAFGHNDYTTDNAYFLRGRGGTGALRLGGVFDWQQSCVNNVGQEWAWNFSFLEPEFLAENEAELIDLVLKTYRAHGRRVRRVAFIEAYVLGTAQMFLWGGGGLQLILRDLHGRGLFTRLAPGSADLLPAAGAGGSQGRTEAEDEIDDATREKLTAAEMTRRTFHNCCAIMTRHDFVGAWQRWKDRPVDRRA